MPCPAPETLAAYQEGGLAPDAREEIETHAAGCPECRERLRCFGAIRIPTREFPVWRAAAAVLLMAVAGWALSRPHPETPKPVAPTAVQASRFDLLSKPGTRLVSGNDRIRAEAGEFWLSADGKPVTLELPGATVSLSRGDLFVSLSAGGKAAWLSEAFAGEAVRIWVLGGEAEVRCGSQMIRLGAGQRLTLGETPQAIPPKEIRSLQEARALAAASLPGLAVFEPGLRLGEDKPSVTASVPVPPAYRWVTVLSGREPGAEVGLRLGIGNAWHPWTVGLAALPPRPQDVVEVIWDGERLKARVNGRQVLSLDGDRLDTALGEAQGPWGLSVWGGSVTVVRSTLMTEGR